MKYTKSQIKKIKSIFKELEDKYGHVPCSFQNQDGDHYCNFYDNGNYISFSASVDISGDYYGCGLYRYENELTIDFDNDIYTLHKVDYFANTIEDYDDDDNLIEKTEYNEEKDNSTYKNFVDLLNDTSDYPEIKYLCCNNDITPNLRNYILEISEEQEIQTYHIEITFNISANTIINSYYDEDTDDRIIERGLINDLFSTEDVYKHVRNNIEDIANKFYNVDSDDFYGHEKDFGWQTSKCIINERYNDINVVDFNISDGSRYKNLNFDIEHKVEFDLANVTIDNAKSVRNIIAKAIKDTEEWLEEKISDDGMESPLDDDKQWDMEDVEVTHCEINVA